MRSPCTAVPECLLPAVGQVLHQSRHAPVNMLIPFHPRGRTMRPPDRTMSAAATCGQHGLTMETCRCAAFLFRTWTRRDGSPTAEGAGLAPRKRRATARRSWSWRQTPGRAPWSPSLGTMQQWKQQDQGEGQVCNLRAGLSHPGHQMSPASMGNRSCRLTLDLRTGKETRGLCSVWLWGGGDSHPAVPRQQFGDSQETRPRP